jgi:D-alanyl-D-alanine carboxypeptidase/D-alanyl-D-alanine-endopeptidase (penicillin-binding protein 4)
MIKKYILLIILLLTPPAFPQLNKDQLKKGIDDLLDDEFFNSTTIAISVYDLTAKEPLYQFNEKKLLNPASNMKLLTSAAGLIFLGPKYNFITSVRYTGNIVNNTLKGDLYVVGDFDPDFSTDDLDYFVRDFRRAGIKEVEGNLYGDVSIKDSVSWGWGWMWDDNQSTDAPYLSALNINSNSIDINVTGSSQGEKAKISIDPETQYVNVINNTLTSLSENQGISISSTWRNGNNNIYVNGFIQPPEFTDNDTVKNSVSIYRPDLYFLTLFREKLNAEGIKINGKMGLLKKPSSAKWLSIFIRSYDAVMLYMNKKSDNLSAEMVLYSLAASFNSSPASAAKGLNVIDSLLTLSGVAKNTYIAADGSGVSRYNLLSADIILSVLKYVYYDYPQLFGLYYNSLPAAGIDGTLSQRMNGTTAEGNVHAKTGTLKGVSCLSGYATAKNNHMLAFSILEQNFINQTSYARSIQDQICILLSKYE